MPCVSETTMSFSAFIAAATAPAAVSALTFSRLPASSRAFVGVPSPHAHLRHEPGLLHLLVDRLSSAMHQHRLHADVVHEHDVGENGGEGLLIVHNRPADLHDDRLVVEALDIPQRLNER